MDQEILFVLLEKYADWEGSFLAAEIMEKSFQKSSGFVVKTLSLTKQAVESIGGFKTFPDYDLNSAPKHFKGLILIGGTSWRTKESELFIPMVQQAIKENVVVGAICDASQFLATHGLINHVKHTSNDLNDLLSIPNSKYKNKSNYQNAQAVSDQHIVTANGSAPLEFAKELLIVLGVSSVEEAEEFYTFNKLGYIEYLKQMKMKNESET